MYKIPSGEIIYIILKVLLKEECLGFLLKIPAAVKSHDVRSTGCKTTKDQIPEAASTSKASVSHI